MKKICLSKKQLYGYIFGLIVTVGVFLYLTYTIYKNKQKDMMANVDLKSNLTPDELKKQLQNIETQLYESSLNEQRCQSELYETKKILKNSGLSVRDSVLLNKVYNPLVSPNRYYPGGRLNEPRVVSYDDYQQIGFIFKDDQRYPLFGRHKYEGRTDRWEYYTMDETRNRIKIPIVSKNDEELYNNDTITINELNDTFNVKIYDYETFRYNPNIF